MSGAEVLAASGIFTAETIGNVNNFCVEIIYDMLIEMNA